MRIMRAWHLIPERNIAIGAAAKCGSTSLRKAIQGTNALGCTLDAQADPPRVHFGDIRGNFWRVGVIRHPVPRFLSLYKNIQERKRSDNNFYKQFEGMSLWDTLSGLLEGGTFHDVHYQPQHWIGLEEAEELVRLEDLGNWWEEAFGEDFPHRNASNLLPYTVDSRLADRIKQTYSADLALWEDARGSQTEDPHGHTDLPQPRRDAAGTGCL